MKQNADSDFMEFENLDVQQMLRNFREISDSMPPPQYQTTDQLSESQVGYLKDIYNFKDQLKSDLSDDRLQSIREKISQMKE